MNMKRIVKTLSFVLIASLLFVGCSQSSNDKDKQTTNLEVTQESGGMKITINMELIHDGKRVYNQNQTSKMVASDAATYEYMDTYVDNSDLAKEAEKYDGAEYKLVKDEKELTITEVINLDFTKLSAEGYKVMTMGQVDLEDKYYIDYEKTLENLEGQGFKVVE